MILHIPITESLSAWIAFDYFVVHKNGSDEAMEALELLRQHLKEGNILKWKFCECGCGAEIPYHRHFVLGHYWQGKSGPQPQLHTQESQDKRHKTLSNRISIGLGSGRMPESLVYGPEFNDKLKKQVRARDNYACRICGKTEKELGKALDVHHIDFDKKNNTLWNLLALCPTCHIDTLRYRRSKLILARFRQIYSEFCCRTGETD